MSKKKKVKFNPSKFHVKSELESLGCSDKFIKKLYKDPNYDNGFYTLDNIPPNKIKKIK